jgi:hypothetical protein
MVLFLTTLLLLLQVLWLCLAAQGDCVDLHSGRAAGSTAGMLDLWYAPAAAAVHAGCC